jgi:hypothetical protein
MDLSKWLRLHWDRAGAWACVAAGAVALLLGWVGVSGSGYAAAQLPYIISGGVGGAFLLGLGAMLWISADLRDEWLKLDRIEERLDGVRDAIRERGVVYVAAVPSAAEGARGGNDGVAQPPADSPASSYAGQTPPGYMVPTPVANVPGLGLLSYQPEPKPPWGGDQMASEPGGDRRRGEDSNGHLPGQPIAGPIKDSAADSGADSPSRRRPRPGSAAKASGDGSGSRSGSQQAASGGADGSQSGSA